MGNACIVVADGRQARFFSIEPGEAPRDRLRLVERGSMENPDLRERGTSTPGRPRTETNTNREAGPVHPIGAQRERHRLDLERRFGHEIARRAAGLTAGWRSGTLVLIAEPRLLGLTRECLRQALEPAIVLKELAKNYTHLTEAELRGQLDLASLLSGRRPGGN